jgi:hypothetical protein
MVEKLGKVVPCIGATILPEAEANPRRNNVVVSKVKAKAQVDPKKPGWQV